MRVISFNANGIRAAAKHGFYEWLIQQKADFVCIQETKCQVPQLLPLELYYPLGYHCDYFDAQKKGYSGVAIYALHKPHHIVKGMGFDYCDNEGRYIQFDYPRLSIISLYLPSGTSSEIRQGVKYHFLEQFSEHLIRLKAQKKALIICGDYNIAHKTMDLKNWKSNQKNSGFLPEERAWMDKLFNELGFIDAFRVLNQNTDEYTWWSFRNRAREKNVGWRIDYQVITPELKESIKAVSIHKEQRFSDHAPVIIDYHGQWHD